MSIKCPHCGKILDIKYLASHLGKVGGEKTKERGKEYYSEIGKRGMAKRWGKK